MNEEIARDTRLRVRVVGSTLISRAVEALLSVQEGVEIIAERGSRASVVLVIGGPGQASLRHYGFPQNRREKSRGRSERFALLTDGTDIDFALAHTIPIRVLIGSNEPLSVMLSGLHVAADGGAFCSPQVVAALMNAAAGKPAASLRADTDNRSALPSTTNSAEEAESALSPAPRNRTLPYGLSQREAEVVIQAIHGLSNRGISELLNLSESTVKFHLYHAYQKLNIERRSQLSEVIDINTLEQKSCPVP